MKRIAPAALVSLVTAGCFGEPTEPTFGDDRRALRASASVTSEASQVAEILVATYYTLPEHSSIVITGAMTPSSGYEFACDPPGWYRGPANVNAGPEQSSNGIGTDGGSPHEAHGIRNVTVVTNAPLPIGTRIYDLAYLGQCGAGFLFRGSVRR